MQERNVTDLSQVWPAPSQPRRIVIIGAGGIVNDAHLPAYAKANLPVAGLFDVEPAKARDTAAKHGIDRVFKTVDEAATANAADVVYDVAVPPAALPGVLEALPDGAAVLMQKPMGRDLDEAKRIRDLCRTKRFTAAVNFQLRFSPMMLAIRDAIAGDWLGDIVEIEVRLNTRTPWELFPYLKTAPRLEILLHSIHYVDWIRSVVGEPVAAWAHSAGHPDHAQLKPSRTSAIFGFADINLRCCLSLHHSYNFGPRHQAAQVQIEGTNGAARGVLGLLLNYPKGEPESLEIATRDMPWTDVPLQGSWFPDAFIGTMSNLQRFVAGEDDVLVTAVDDAYKTMAVVEACYQSDEQGGTRVPD